MTHESDYGITIPIAGHLYRDERLFVDDPLAIDYDETIEAEYLDCQNISVVANDRGLIVILLELSGTEYPPLALSMSASDARHVAEHIIEYLSGKCH